MEAPFAHTRSRLLTLVGLLAWLSAPVLQAQPLDQLVRLDYAGEPLGAVLADLEQRYAVYFTYSSYHVPVEEPVFLRMDEVRLASALDTLLAATSIIYIEVDGQVVLRPDPHKELLSRIDPLSSSGDGPLRPLSPQAPPRNRQPWEEEMVTLGSIRLELPGGDRTAEVDLEKYREAMRQAARKPEAETVLEENLFSDHQLAQVSLLPYLGTNSYRSNEVTNNFSLNVFWGTNGGVDGVELGGFVNTVVKDVKGIQVAGLGNTVGGKVTGTQLAGLFNLTQDTLVGAQAAGLFNITRQAEAAQVAGLFNLNRQDFAGLQMAGGFNLSAGKAEAVQMAGLFNVAGDKTKTQLAGLFNWAGDVSGSQISSLLNVGKKVRGSQIGLINVADTIAGPSVGLLNIVRKGYNRIELGGSATLFANLGFKLGSHKFYNIFHFGGRWDARERQVNEVTTQQGIFLSWGLGYGVGAVAVFSPRTAMNVELVATHINELEEWTNELNLLNQLRITFDLRLGSGRPSFFFGPTANLLVSRRVDPDTGLIGSGIAPYTLYEETVGDTNLKFWAGGYCGFRF